MVTDDASAEQAAEFMAAHCDTATGDAVPRGYPLLSARDGLPRRRIRLPALRDAGVPDPGSALFRYAGIATWWEPSAADREEMRAAVLRVAGVAAGAGSATAGRSASTG